MPDVVEGWKENVEHDEGVVPSIVLVMVESASPGRVDVWMIVIFWVVLGVVGMFVVCGVVRVEVIVRPLCRRESGVAIREAICVCRAAFSVVWMESSSCVVYSRE